VVSLTASPATGWEVSSWWGTDDDGSTSTTNHVTMPTSSRSAGVNYAPMPEECFTLTLSHTGQGSDPSALPINSTGCPAGQYHAGEVVSLTASPASGWEVDSWWGTDDNGSTSATNQLTMPASGRSAGVNYVETPEACYALTLGHTGSGSDPTASPTNSAGCSPGQYQVGEPAAGWQVSSWSGTSSDASTSTVNSLAMPASSHTAGVNYSEIPTGNVVLNLAKNFAENYVVPGGSGYSFTLFVSSTGSDPATSVVVSDLVDNRLRVTSADCGGGANSSAGNEVTCTYGTLAPAGGSATVTVSYDVKPSAKPPLTLVNVASASDGTGHQTEGSDSVEVIDDCGAAPELDLAEEVVDSADVREACKSISAGPSFEVVAPAGDLVFRAGETIILRNGFMVEAEAGFTAEIDPSLNGG
jgi:hypothetical protein